MFSASAHSLRIFADSVIDPTVIVRPIQSTPGDRWRLFLASASGLDSQSRSNPSWILAKRWSSQRTAKPGINPRLPEIRHISLSLAPAVHFANHPHDMGRSVGFFEGLMVQRQAYLELCDFASRSCEAG
jgi:hypothetical protein